jgi:hypothetical protein
MNSAKNATTKFSAFFLMYGYEPNTPVQAIVSALTDAPAGVKQVKQTADMLDKMAADMLQAQDAMLVAQQQQAVQANKHRRDLKLSVGDLVYLSSEHLRLKGVSRKLAPRWCGPFPVEKIINDVSVKLTLPDLIGLHPVVHVSQLKLYIAQQRWVSRQHAPRAILDDEGQTSFLVEGILAHRKVLQRSGVKLQYKYLVKWLGYPIWDCTWEPESSFPNNSSVLPVYKAQNKL